VAPILPCNEAALIACLRWIRTTKTFKTFSRVFGPKKLAHRPPRRLRGLALSFTPALTLVFQAFMLLVAIFALIVVLMAWLCYGDCQH
jgi:hypothetical protein